MRPTHVNDEVCSACTKFVTKQSIRQLAARRFVFLLGHRLSVISCSCLGATFAEIICTAPRDRSAASGVTGVPICGILMKELEISTLCACPRYLPTQMLGG